ncbi:MAG TPA: hypothetical protein VG940_01865 [Gemmatimonadales bacterium]|nr:hypothetical protein [Gemmatimonadales bacterium]
MYAALIDIRDPFPGQRLEPEADIGVGRAAFAAEDVALSEERGEVRSDPDIGARLEDHMRQAGVDPELGDLFAVRGDGTGRVEGAEFLEELHRLGVGRGGRGVEPGELIGTGTLHREIQRQRRQVGFEDLGRAARHEPPLFILVPAPVADPGRQAARAAAALVRTRAGDAHGGEAGHPDARRELRHPRHPAIDHHRHPFDGEARFGDARGEDHLPPARRGGADGAFLVGLGEVAVEWDDVERRELRVESSEGGPDLADTGQEGEDVALGGVGERLTDRAGHDALHPLVGAAGDPPRLHGKGAPFARHDRRVAEQLCDGGPIERGRHHEDAELGAEELLGLQGEREAQVAREGAFVELVEDDQAVVLERRVVPDDPGEHPFGDDLDPGLS